MENKNNKIDIFSRDLSSVEDFDSYKKAFLKKYGDQIDSREPFQLYLDISVVDEYGDHIKGIRIDKDSWKTITETLLKYYHIDE